MLVASCIPTKRCTLVSRRKFIAQAGLASGAAVGLLVEPLAGQLDVQPSTHPENAVHVSTLRIIRKHFRKLKKNPKHNIFASGELATAFRMHCDAMQASGLNAAMTKAQSASSQPPVIRHEHLDQAFTTLEKLGVHLPNDAKQYATAHILAASTQVAPKVSRALQTYTVLKIQRSVHGELITGKLAHDKGLKIASSFHHAEQPTRLVRAGYTLGLSNPIHAALQDNTIDQGGGDDDGWDDGDSDDGGDTGTGGTDLGGGTDGGADPGFSGSTAFDDPSDDYSASFSSWYGSGLTYTTPSGVTLQGCTVFNALIAFGAGSFAAGVAYLDSIGAASSVVLAGVTVTPGAIVLLLVVLAGLAAYLAIVC